jgi:thioredoxin-like negative regulator of GroEL
MGSMASSLQQVTAADFQQEVVESTLPVVVDFMGPN